MLNVENFLHLVHYALIIYFKHADESVTFALFHQSESKG